MKVRQTEPRFLWTVSSAAQIGDRGETRHTPAPDVPPATGSGALVPSRWLMGEQVFCIFHSLLIHLRRRRKDRGHLPIFPAVQQRDGCTPSRCHGLRAIQTASERAGNI